MGLGAMDRLEEKGEEEQSATSTAAAASAAAVSCSICFEIVMISGDRSTARLQCGHEFHLDCIGSAFNAKGVMQCPNCRKIGKGNWLYAAGCRSMPELNVESWPHDDDLYEFGYPEMPIGVHWCPFSRLARISASLEEGESSPAFAFQDLLVHHAAFAEHIAAMSTAHACPYLAYLQPHQPSSSSNPTTTSSENPADVAPYQHWSPVPPAAEVQDHGSPAVDLQYHGLEHTSFPQFPPNNYSGDTEQVPAPSATTTASRFGSHGLQRTGSHARRYFIAPSSGSRVSSSFVSSLFPPYLSNTQAQGHLHEHQQHHSSSNVHGPMFSGVARRSVGMRALPPGPTRPTPLENAAFYHPSNPTSRSETGNSGSTHFYAWERDRFAPIPLLPVDIESGWWDPVPPPFAGSSDPNSRTGMWQRHGSERSSSHGRSEGSSYRPGHNTRTHHFI